MKRVLDERRWRLTRSLGQNFLHDGNQLGRMLAAAELEGQDRVLEIGPGLGVLTEGLLERAAEVWAVEKDGRLVGYLQERFAAAPRLRLFHADAVGFLQEPPGDWSSWKLVSNLPYSAASPILAGLAMGGHGPGRIVATVQQEVASRLVARPGTADYGVLTLLVQLGYECRGSFRIPATCFFPVPEVESACVTLVRRATPWLEGDEVRWYTRLVKRAFSQRRKMMFKLLKSEWPEPVLAEAFLALGLSMTVRAERVAPEQFAALTHRLGQPSGGHGDKGPDA
jgi:16S rRNA (adenine1518-N6/adenine1519-N6)-dimethyltransferase